MCFFTLAPVLYRVIPSTQWVYEENDSANKKSKTYPISSIGALDETITELRDILSLALDLRKVESNVKYAKSIFLIFLLYFFLHIIIFFID